MKAAKQLQTGNLSRISIHFFPSILREAMWFCFGLSCNARGRSLWQFYCRLIDPFGKMKLIQDRTTSRLAAASESIFPPTCDKETATPSAHSAKHPVPDLLNEKKIFPRSHFWLWKTLQLFAKVNVFSHPIAPFPKAAFSYHRVG